MKTSQNRESKPSRISAPSPKPRKYLYEKIMAYTVTHINGEDSVWIMNVFNINVGPAVLNCLMIIVSCIFCHPVTKDGATLQITVDGDAGAEVVGGSGATAANTNDPLYFGGLPGKKMPSSHCIRVKKQKQGNTESWGRPSCLVTGFGCVRPLYDEVPLYNV